MKIICAWCGGVIADGPADSPVSHGICFPCALEVGAAMAKMAVAAADAEAAVATAKMDGADAVIIRPVTVKQTPHERITLR